MQMLYDSDSFVVVHQVVNSPDEGVLHDPFDKPRHGFEIVDKRSNKEVFLHDKWADAFQAQVNAWQANTPTQEEVEQCLAGYAELAQLPLVMH